MVDLVGGALKAIRLELPEPQGREAMVVILQVVLAVEVEKARLVVTLLVILEVLVALVVCPVLRVSQRRMVEEEVEAVLPQTQAVLVVLAEVELVGLEGPITQAQVQLIAAEVEVELVQLLEAPV